MKLFKVMVSKTAIMLVIAPDEGTAIAVARVRRGGNLWAEVSAAMMCSDLSRPWASAEFEVF